MARPHLRDGRPRRRRRSLVYDLRRGRRSRALVGDLRAAELVASEEAYLGARVRALTVRLAAKDASTEEHTRRVATLAVQIGEQLGLSPTRLRSLAIGGLLHDIGKLSIPDAILQKPGPLDDDEYDVVKQHPERGRELLERARRLRRRASAGSCSTITSGSTAAATRAALAGERARPLDADPRGLRRLRRARLAARLPRRRGRASRRSSLLRDESGTAFDSRCVAALERIVGVERDAVRARGAQSSFASAEWAMTSAGSRCISDR